MLDRKVFVSFQKTLTIISVSTNMKMCDSIRAPRVAANSSVTVEVCPALLRRPCLFAISPSKLLEGDVVGRVPYVHF